MLHSASEGCAGVVVRMLVAALFTFYVLRFTSAARAPPGLGNSPPNATKSSTSSSGPNTTRRPICSSQGSALTAAGEFEKFKIQFPDSSELSYALFMRGYALQQANQRNNAIKVYQEVLDYFGDQVDDAAPALYYMGVARIDNGETLKGLQCMKTLVESKTYQHHPLAAGALRRLADNYWNKKDPAEAVKYWRQTVKDFGQTNDAERDQATANLAAYAIINQDYAGFESFYLDDTNRDKPDSRRWVAETIANRAYYLFAANNFDRKKVPTPKESTTSARHMSSISNQLSPGGKRPTIRGVTTPIRFIRSRISIPTSRSAIRKSQMSLPG